MQSRIRYSVLATSLLLLAVAGASDARGQLPAPNSAGVSTGHIHFRVSDPDLHREFWQSLGATEVSGGIPRLSVDGIYLLFAEGEPSGPSDGTSMNHVGFLTRSYERTKAGLEAVEATIRVDNAETGQILATLPDGVGIELQACDTPTEFEDCPGLVGDIQFHHFHAMSPDNAAVRQWYLDAFGMDSGERRGSPSAVVPGGRVDFMAGRGGGGRGGRGAGARDGGPRGGAQAGPAPDGGARGGGVAALAGTQGRAIDHIGFEVADMAATVAHLEGMGVQMDSAPRSVGNLTIAFLTDPDGTYIELTQGLGQ